MRKKTADVTIDLTKDVNKHTESVDREIDFSEIQYNLLGLATADLVAVAKNALEIMGRIDEEKPIRLQEINALYNRTQIASAKIGNITLGHELETFFLKREAEEEKRDAEKAD